MSEVVFVGLGLNNENGLSIQGLNELKSASAIFIEVYTSFLPEFSMSRLEQICGKKLIHLVRDDLEERNGDVILENAKKAKTVLLVPGDPLIATTHNALRIRASELGIKTRIVHGASILSAAIGLSGLHNYNFGKTVTVPFSENRSKTPNEVILQNMKRGLHTLCLLDIDVEKKRYLTIHEALKSLVLNEKEEKEKVLTDETLFVGVCRAGSSNVTVKAGFLGELKDYDFGSPPHTLIFPGKLHFMEVEALIQLAEASPKIRGLSR